MRSALLGACASLALFACGASTSSLRAQDAPDFAEKVLPLFEKRCLQCHATPGRGPDGQMRRTKGGLRLDSRAAILAGGDGGAVLFPGRPDDSELYTRTMLPADDDDVMPQKGDHLSSAESDLLRRWIAAGAPFGDWTGASASAPAKPETSNPDTPLRSAREVERERVAEGATSASPAAIEKAARAGARIADLCGDGRLLGLSFEGSRDRIDDGSLQELEGLLANLGELDLARTRIDDRALAIIARCPRLMRLDLSETSVTTRGLRELSRATELRTLILVGTGVDRGIADLLGRDASWPRLEAIHLWRSACDTAALEAVRDLRPTLRVLGAPELPPPPGEDESPRGRRRKR